MAENLDDWERFATGLSYGYNSQLHRSTGFSPMELTVSRLPVHFSIQKVATAGESDYLLQREQFLARLKALMSAANVNLCLAQARYKADFEKAVKPSAEDILSGSYVFLRQEAPTKDEPERNKLASVATGP